MNTHAQLLDCTLRDGAYLVDKQFGAKNIHGIVGGLVKAGLDFVEIGFLQNDGFGEGKTVFKNSQDAARYIPAERGKSRFAVLADYSRYDVSNLDPYTGQSFDAVRACFFKHERQDVVAFWRRVKELGYLLFVQPVDILGYTDLELIELIQSVNEVQPYCFSIVDTFGSMYESDLQRVYSLIHHNLAPGIRIGFHSHNNLQMSSALSQSFLKISLGQRQVVIDSTLAGMGRGAGNTPTELVAEYMVSRLGYSYQMDELMDLMDSYIDNLRARCTWGYSLPYFVAGTFSAHVNNIVYLAKKNRIQARDMRYLLDKIGEKARKRYDYDLLEQEYSAYIRSSIDDTAALAALKDQLAGRPVLLLAPGKSIEAQREQISAYILQEKPVVISVNFIGRAFPVDYLFFSNSKRFNTWKMEKDFSSFPKILTSNITAAENDSLVLSFARLAKYMNRYEDNAVILMLCLLDLLGVQRIAIAGFDGFQGGGRNYADSEMEISVRKSMELNREVENALDEYFRERRTPAHLQLLTGSVFEHIFEKFA